MLWKRIKDKKFVMVMKQLLKCGIMDQNHYEHNFIGTPQGGIVSALVLNIYIFCLDRYVSKQIIQKQNLNLPTQSQS